MFGSLFGSLVSQKQLLKMVIQFLAKIGAAQAEPFVEDVLTHRMSDAGRADLAKGLAAAGAALAAKDVHGAASVLAGLIGDFHG